MNLPEFINKLKVATGDEAIELVEMLQAGKVSGLPVSPLDTMESGGWCVECMERMAQPGSELCIKCVKLGCQCKECEKVKHDSDCSVHNGPAEKAGSCDCTQRCTAERPCLSCYNDSGPCESA